MDSRWIAGLIAGSFCMAAAQPAGRVFEVASVKPLEGATGAYFQVRTSGARFSAKACKIKELVMYAYNLRNYEVAFASRQFPDDFRYDIVAVAGGDAVPTKDEFRMLLQALLADRFQLKVHREQREMRVYALVPDPKGRRLNESAPETSRLAQVGGQGRNYEVTLRKVTMEDIRRVVENAFLDLPVIDKTDLTGNYDAMLTYTPNLRDYAANPDPSDISIFTAVQTDLGLKLSAVKVVVDILVIDHVAKPSAN